MSHHSTFVFADIAGFTALTEAHGDDAAADLAVDFAQRVHDRLVGDGGEVVKTIGDAVMIRMDTPATAITLGLEIVEDLMAGHGEPTVRVGMHAGPASERDGDYFGASVNLAARIAAFAGGGEVALSAAVRDAAASEAHRACRHRVRLLLGQLRGAVRGGAGGVHAQAPHVLRSGREAALAASRAPWVTCDPSTPSSRPSSWPSRRFQRGRRRPATVRRTPPCGACSSP